MESLLDEGSGGSTFAPPEPIKPIPDFKAPPSIPQSGGFKVPAPMPKPGGLMAPPPIIQESFRMPDTKPKDKGFDWYDQSMSGALRGILTNKAGLGDFQEDIQRKNQQAMQPSPYLDLGQGETFHHVSPLDSIQKIKKQRQGSVFLTQDPNLLNAVINVKGYDQKWSAYESEVRAEPNKVLKWSTMPVEEKELLLKDYMEWTMAGRNLPGIDEDTSDSDLRRYHTISQIKRMAEDDEEMEGGFTRLLDDDLVDFLTYKGYQASLFNDLGYGNSLAVFDDSLLENLRVHTRKTDGPSFENFLRTQIGQRTDSAGVQALPDDELQEYTPTLQQMMRGTLTQQPTRGSGDIKPQQRY